MEYKTIIGTASAEFTEKRSRFIGYVSHVETKAQADEFINKIKAENYNAAHNVFAYVLRDGMIKKYSDNGEPQGTAGIPVLDVIEREELTDCVVVATRYFGGILLGAGGLVRAYSHTAKIAVDVGTIVTMSECDCLKIECDYNFYGMLARITQEYGGVIDNVDYTDKVTVCLHLKQNITENYMNKVVDLSLGKFRATVTGTVFCPTKNYFD